MVKCTQSKDWSFFFFKWVSCITPYVCFKLKNGLHNKKWTNPLPVYVLYECDGLSLNNFKYNNYSEQQIVPLSPSKFTKLIGFQKLTLQDGAPGYLVNKI